MSNPIVIRKTLDINEAPQLVYDWFKDTFAQDGLSQNTYHIIEAVPQSIDEYNGMPELVYKWFISQGIREPEYTLSDDGLPDFTALPETIMILFWW